MLILSLHIVITSFTQVFLVITIGSIITGKKIKIYVRKIDINYHSNNNVIKNSIPFRD